MVSNENPPFGGDGGHCVSGSEVFSSEETGINGPCSRPDHGDGGAESGKSDRNPWITAVGECDPKFDRCDQASYNRGP